MVNALNGSSAITVGPVESNDFFIGWAFDSGPVGTSTDVGRGRYDGTFESWLNLGAEGISNDAGLPFTYADFTVVPRPAAVWLLGSGLVALGAVARRRKQTA